MYSMVVNIAAQYVPDFYNNVPKILFIDEVLKSQSK
jgi:hypothetical protein